jgi:hypothetical protein
VGTQVKLVVGCSAVAGGSSANTSATRHGETWKETL